MTPSLRPCYASFVRVAIMAISEDKKTKRETLNLRVRPEVRSLIDRAAKLAGKNRTDFVLDAAQQAAENAILDRTVHTFSAKAYAEFVARLDAPPRPNKRLRQSLQTAAPWE
jgi:uncharacterized protein (DUF1778 family)